MNKVILCGRLTKDPEIRNADSDKKVARCTLAVNRNYKREGDETNADFIGLVAFKNQADFLEKYGRKGTKFIVTGRTILEIHLKERHIRQSSRCLLVIWQNTVLTT